jgi:hypothetical protein
MPKFTLLSLIILSFFLLFIACSDSDNEFTEEEKLELISLLLYEKSDLASNNDWIFFRDDSLFVDLMVSAGATDISGEVKRKDGENDDEYLARRRKLAKLASVENFNAEVYYSDSYIDNESVQNVYDFPSLYELRKQGMRMGDTFYGDSCISYDGYYWDHILSVNLELDLEKTTDDLLKNDLDVSKVTPTYFTNIRIQDKDKIASEPYSIPKFYLDSISYFYKEFFIESSEKGILNMHRNQFRFYPFRGEGWYLLRFYSQTNRLINLELKDNAQPQKKHLSTNELLMKYEKHLRKELAEYDLPKIDSIYDTKIKNKIKQAYHKAKKKSYKDSRKIELYHWLVKEIQWREIEYRSAEKDIEVLFKVVFSDTKD